MSKISMLITIAVLLIITLSIVYIDKTRMPTQLPSIDWVSNAILEDAKSKFGDADIVEIINKTKEIDDNGKPYYIITVRVTYNISSPCPKRYHIYYDYPAHHFVTNVPELITRSCNPCVCPSETCLILFDEEAIAASYHVGNISNYYSTYGGKPEDVKRHGDMWYVKWLFGNETENYTAIVEISKFCNYSNITWE